MAYTTTTSIKRARDARAGGFTLTEVMVGATLGSFVLAGVLSAYLVLGRSGVRAYNYASLSIDVRRMFEEFAQDARMASDIIWNDANSITLKVPDHYTSTANLVTYYHDGGSSRFLRRPGDAASTEIPQVLARNVTSATFFRFDRLDAAASTDSGTKRIEVALRLRAGANTAATATENAVSASFIMRNKLAN